MKSKKKTKWEIVDIGNFRHERTIKYGDRTFKTSRDYPVFLVTELVIGGNNKLIFKSGRYQDFYPAIRNFKEMVEKGHI